MISKNLLKKNFIVSQYEIIWAGVTEILFLDPNQPLSTCREVSCKDCNLSKDLICHFNPFHLLRFLLFAFPPFIIGGIGIWFFNPILLLPWLLVILLYFGLIEIRVMCSHCPHYAEPGISTLKCWANYGVPKFWKYRSGPMSSIEKIVFISGLALIFGYPAIFIFLLQNILIIIAYLLAFSAGAFFLLVFQCTHCINFTCPFNRVKSKTRNKFYAKNPIIRKAWNK